MPTDLKSEIALGRFLLSATRRNILKYYNQAISTDEKADGSPVTIADQSTEELMRKTLESETPDYGILGEEFGETSGKGARKWVLDPIDGTKSFIHGVPLFGTLLALLENETPILGFMDFPALDVMIWGSQGGGAFVNDKPCRVSEINTIGEALLLDGSPRTMEKKGYGQPWQKLTSNAKLHRGWGDCYGYYLVATGKAEAMVDPIANLWDLAAVDIIVREAGGQFTTLSGERTPAGGNGIGSNGKVHSAIVEEFQVFLNK